MMAMLLYSISLPVFYPVKTIDSRAVAYQVVFLAPPTTRGAGQTQEAQIAPLFRPAGGGSVALN